MPASIVAEIPNIFAHVPRWCGRAMIKAPLTTMTTRPWRRHRSATIVAVRQVYCWSVPFEGRVGPLGKKMRKRSNLLQVNVTMSS